MVGRKRKVKEDFKPPTWVAFQSESESDDNSTGENWTKRARPMFLSEETPTYEDPPCQSASISGKATTNPNSNTDTISAPLIGTSTSLGANLAAPTITQTTNACVQEIGPQLSQEATNDFITSTPSSTLLHPQIQSPQKNELEYSYTEISLPDSDHELLSDIDLEHIEDPFVESDSPEAERADIEVPTSPLINEVQPEIDDGAQPTPNSEDEDECSDCDFDFEVVNSYGFVTLSILSTLFSLFQEESGAHSYNTILRKLANDWIVTEIQHHVSKAASDAFFELGKKWFHVLFEAKYREGVSKKTPQFVHIRRRLYDKYTPPVRMEIGYRNKESGLVEIQKDLLSTPTSKFPPSQFQKLYEIASVEVIKQKIYEVT